MIDSDRKKPGSSGSVDQLGTLTSTMLVHLSLSGNPYRTSDAHSFIDVGQIR